MAANRVYDVKPRLSLRSREKAVEAPGEVHSARSAYVLLAPGLILFLAVIVLSMGQTFWRSFYLWDGLTTPEWVGLENYRSILSDPEVRLALVHSGVLLLFACVLPVITGLVLAVSLSRVRVRGLTLFRALLFAPQVLSGIAIGIIWRWMYEPSQGPINKALISLGVPEWAKPWLGDFSVALPAIGVIGMWATMGLCMVLLLAGIQKIPTSLYDAARVDGAGWFAELRAVTIPGLRNELIVSVTIALIISLRIFDIVFVTTKGGPGDSTLVPALLIYWRAFQHGLVGSGAALAVLLGAIILTLSVIIHRIGERNR